MVECPQCEVELEYFEREHWSGYNDWYRCPRCLMEVCYMEEL